MSATLQQRVTGILTSPHTEWPRIAAEAETVSGLYTRYILLLAAIGPVAQFLRYPSLFSPVVAIASYIVGLAAILICAKIIEWLAPKFQSTGDTVQALKLVAYAATPSWLAGIGNLIPLLGFLIAIVGTLYAIYLYYLGLGPVLKTPNEQAVPFMLVSAIAIIVVFVVLSAFLIPLGFAGRMGIL